MMKNLKRKKITENGRILTIHRTQENLFLGDSCRMIDAETMKVLATHTKTVSCITSHKYTDSDALMLGCGSYDGKVSLFTKTKKSINFLDTIEGPDTEIKSISFDDSFIALATRGKTVWILKRLTNGNGFNFDIQNIINDHTQDVKGVLLRNGVLYSWSYDKTIKIYNEGEEGFEMIQSIDCSDTIWNVLFVGGFLIAALQNGCLEIFKKSPIFYGRVKSLKFSVTPLICSRQVDMNSIALVCNESVILIIDDQFMIQDQFDVEEKITAIEVFNDDESAGGLIYVGTESGELLSLTI